MTEKETLQWIYLNLGQPIDLAIGESKKKNQQLLYTKDWLSAIAMRETGFLIARYVAQGAKPSIIQTFMRGDYCQRAGEKEKSYHGYSYWQIDIGSYPDWIKSGAWKDPYKSCIKAISVLEEKRLWLNEHLPQVTGFDLSRAITAAYNCGEGNVKHVIESGQDIDSRTYNKDYSAEVWRYRQLFNIIQQQQQNKPA